MPRGHSTWDKDALRKINEMKKDGATWAEIAAALGSTRDAVRAVYRRIKNGEIPIDGGGDEKKSAAKEFLAITHDGKKGTAGQNWRGIVQEALRRQGFREETQGVAPRFAEVRIQTKRPIVVVFTGDWHMGAGHTAYDKWIDDVRFILDTDGVYLVDVGDDRENIRRFRTLSAVFGQILSPTEQAYLIRGIVDELTEKNKLLAKVGGNHDIEFDERAGFAEIAQRYMYENMRAPLFMNRGLVTLYIGDTEYTVLLFHKSRFRSFLTPTHGARRELMLSAPHADIVAGGHDHQPGIEVFWYNMLTDPMPTVLIKVGTYSDSNYGWKYFHNGGFPINPSVVLFPSERKAIPFASPRDAVAFAQALSQKEE